HIFTRIRNPEKPGKNIIELLLWDSYTKILNFHGYPFIFSFCKNDDFSGVGVFHSIGEKINNHLFQTFTVGLYGKPAQIALAKKRMLPTDVHHAVYTFIDKFIDVEPRYIQHQLSFFNTGNIQKI